MPFIDESTKCCRGFGDEFRHRVGRPYKKADPHLYESILTNGDEEKAIEFAAFRIEMCSATTVHVLVQEIREKTKGHSYSIIINLGLQPISYYFEKQQRKKKLICARETIKALCRKSKHRSRSY